MCAITYDDLCASVSLCAYKYIIFTIMWCRIVPIELSEWMMKEQNQQREGKRTSIHSEKQENREMDGLEVKWREAIRLIDWTNECKQIESLFNRNGCSQLNHHTYQIMPAKSTQFFYSIVPTTYETFTVFVFASNMPMQNHFNTSKTINFPIKSLNY